MTQDDDLEAFLAQYLERDDPPPARRAPVRRGHATIVSLQGLDRQGLLSPYSRRLRPQ